VAFVNALQLEATQAMPALCRFNYDARPGLMSPNLSIAKFAYYNIFAADTLLYDVTLTSDLVTLTFDLEHLQCIACDMMKLCAKFQHNWAIRDRVIAISVFELNDLEHCVTCCARLWDNFRQV